MKRQKIRKLLTLLAISSMTSSVIGVVSCTPNSSVTDSDNSSKKLHQLIMI